jgi:hypothetical protein
MERHPIIVLKAESTFVHKGDSVFMRKGRWSPGMTVRCLSRSLSCTLSDQVMEGGRAWGSGGAGRVKKKSGKSVLLGSAN